MQKRPEKTRNIKSLSINTGGGQSQQGGNASTSNPNGDVPSEKGADSAGVESPPQKKRSRHNSGTKLIQEQQSTQKNAAKKAENIMQHDTNEAVKSPNETKFSAKEILSRQNRSTSSLNRSLRAKQKIINSKDPIVRSPVAIAELMKSPQTAVGPNKISESEPADGGSSGSIVGGGNLVGLGTSAQASLTENQKNKQGKDNTKANAKSAKPNSSKTDFFAAKLASAVDDVESSDSDETFVYENNSNENESEAENAQERHLSVKQDNTSAVQSSSNSITGVSNNGKQTEVVTGEGDGVALNTKNKRKDSSMKGDVPSKSAGRPENKEGDQLSRNPELENKVTPSMSRKSLFPVDDNESTRKHEATSMTRPKPFSASSSSSIPVHSPFPMPTTSRNSLHRYDPIKASSNEETNDENYFYDDLDNTDMTDEYSIEDDNFSTKRDSSLAPFYNVDPSLENQVKNIEGDRSSVGSSKKKWWSRKHNPSVSSSKLRTTTSKLFDSKGSQPRRYSTIPDDVDLEDFDDELIYYDNNIRGSNGNPNLQTNVNYNEASSLLRANNRIPHYRSLNLNLPGEKKKPPINKRYLSTGHAFFPGQNRDNTRLPSTKQAVPYQIADIFPFPYTEADAEGYRYSDLDDDIQAKAAPEASLNQGRNLSGFSYRHLPHLNSQYFYPQKMTMMNGNYKETKYIKNFIFAILSIISILSIGFVMGFILATTKDLSHVKITRIENPIVTKDELIFNVVVEAFNPGWFSVEIEDAELDLFAKSGYISDKYYETDKSLSPSNYLNTVETVLLGTIYNLESSMVFNGGFFNRDSSEQSAEVRLIYPGKNLTDFSLIGLDGSSEPDNSRKWAKISKHPFDLVIRGILKYNLRLTSNVKSVVVDKVSYVDPKASG